MVKREKTRIIVPAFESWFPTCETLSKSLTSLSLLFPFTNGNDGTYPQRAVRISEMLYIEYREQWLKHRIRSIYTVSAVITTLTLWVHLCFPTEVLSQALWRPFLPLGYYHLQVALTRGGYRILHPFFLVLQASVPTQSTSRSLPSIFLHFPEVSGETRGRVQPWKRQGHSAASDVSSSAKTPLPEVTRSLRG